jgi:RecA-family ATPase
MVRASSFVGMPVPERRWHVEGLLPAGTVTGLSGDGATGKSTIALQLAVVTVTGGYWFGIEVARGPAIYVTAEDDMDEMQRRLDAITAALGTDLAALDELHIVPLAHRDALLATTDSRTGILRPTDLFRAFDDRVAEVRPALVLLDTKADLFGGDENNRAHARQFVGMLRAQAIRHDTTELLLDHPSLGGLASGTGTSGSTGWSNSLRSRLYFERVKDDAGNETDVDARLLRVMKSNYARSGTEMKIRWDGGVFKLASSGAGGFDRYAAQQDADQVFLKLVAAYEAEGRTVSTAGPAYAPTVFAKDARSQGVGKRGLTDAMNRLFETKRVVLEEFGPPSHRRKRIVPARVEGSE